MDYPVIKFQGSEVELKCTLAAAKAVSRLSRQAFADGAPQGPNSLAFMAMGGDIQAVALAIAAVTGKRLGEVEEVVFSEGTGQYALPVSEFYLRLGNGGKPLMDAQEGSEDANPPKASD